MALQKYMWNESRVSKYLNYFIAIETSIVHTQVE